MAVDEHRPRKLTEPATAAVLAVIVLLSVALDLGWKRTRDSQVPSR